MEIRIKVCSRFETDFISRDDVEPVILLVHFLEGRFVVMFEGNVDGQVRIGGCPHLSFVSNAERFFRTGLIRSLSCCSFKVSFCKL